jgi:hypothetical protein
MRGRTVHEVNCVVGLCTKAWEKMLELLDRANHVFVMNLFRAKANIWALEDDERVDEYKHVQALREDADKYMTKFCLSAIDIYCENRDLLGDEIDIHTLCEELLLDDQLEIHINYGFPLRSGFSSSGCLPWDYFRTPYHTWIQYEFLNYEKQHTGEE